uniref:Uncharacterized protein n=1 Tax=Anguilla anguilla TaxID=7936 RepID=A0A0E9R8J7_ANGAN
MGVSVGDLLIGINIKYHTHRYKELFHMKTKGD